MFMCSRIIGTVCVLYAEYCFSLSSLYLVSAQGIVGCIIIVRNCYYLHENSLFTLMMMMKNFKVCCLTLQGCLYLSEALISNAVVI